MVRFQLKAPICLSRVWLSYWAFTRELIITLLMCLTDAFKSLENYLGVVDLPCFQSPYSMSQETTWVYVNYILGLLCKAPETTCCDCTFHIFFKYIFINKISLWLSGIIVYVWFPSLSEWYPAVINQNIFSLESTCEILSASYSAELNASQSLSSSYLDYWHDYPAHFQWTARCYRKGVLSTCFPCSKNCISVVTTALMRLFLALQRTK